ncbi:gp53-like domain-containing protein [Photorhabdus antumapuensis]|uniref:gp53-like domain-containing protein n=1 Tax=Photorhabdus antumapuensis TaxID=2862867 RepID=UPI001CECF0DC|nr:phage tail protein [Photorhabdus antumapuensis]MCA6221906.1 phage tail protein [Photorhabdus antumapuensis]
MSAKNDFKAFAISSNANVPSQQSYETYPNLLVGFLDNQYIPNHILNKILRQASTISSAVADFIATESGTDVLDDGNVTKITAQFKSVLEQKIAKCCNLNVNTANKVVNGWWKCGDTGIIIQWGQASGAMNINDYRNFTIPFPNACFQIVATYPDFGNYGSGVAAMPISASQFIVTCRNSIHELSSNLVRYLAIGY